MNARTVPGFVAGLIAMLLLARNGYITIGNAPCAEQLHYDRDRPLILPSDSTLTTSIIIQEAVDRLRVELDDQWGNSFILEPRLISVNHHTPDEPFWDVATYVYLRMWGGGAGVEGDIEVVVEVFDARYVPERGYIVAEIVRMGWGEVRVYLDGTLQMRMPALQPGYVPTAPAYMELIIG